MADVAASCTQPVCEIGKCIWAGIAKRINYGRKLSKNWKALCKKASELGIKRDDIFTEIERLKPQKTPKKECDDWGKNVAEMEKKVETMKQEFDVDKRCVRGLCLDIFARIELGERVVNMISEITILLDKSKFENGYLVDSLPAKVEKRPHPHSKLTPRAYEMLDRVLEKVRDNSTPKIGIWGMGGIGKTTVLQLLNNTSKIVAMFDFVIWVTASKSQNIRTIQEVIGRRCLSIDINTLRILSDDEVTSKLLEKLDGKKYMLLLDDVWETVDLAAVGLPNANQDNGCKVVLTTRKLEVCRKMGTDTEINVQVLSDEEAWEMFRLNVGDVARLDPIKPLAESIARECDGLPLALKVVSSVLRKEANESVWRNFLKELRSPATSFITDFDEGVFNILKVSYDQLKDINQKKCLLFCGLYPEDREIRKSELIAYWRAEGILSSKLTLAEAYDKGDAILQVLIDASLLESGYHNNYVKMHDVIRDLVLAMTSLKGGEEPAHLVRAGICSENMPEEVEWTKATRISFIDHDLRHLPESPDCPELLTLLLQGNYNLEMIPETFFNNMPNIRVLDLSHTRIKTLPSSIFKLDCLRELVLLGCDWLESAGEISRLSHLEVFKLIGVLNDESTEILVKELSKMSSLSSLEFNFRRVSNLLLFLQNSKLWKERRLTEFRFLLENDQSGYVDKFWQLAVHKTCLSYDGTRGDDRGSGLPPAIEDVLSRSDSFALQGHERLGTLSEVGAHNTCELRNCQIERCVALEQIVNRKGLEMGVFSNLEYLLLADLLNLKSIVSLDMEAPPPNVNTFTNLTTLFLYDCPQIEHVFSNGFIVHQLSNLERLWINSCLGLKGMIPDDQKVKYEALPKLRGLQLINLPEFVSFFNGVPMCWQSLEKLRIEDCPNRFALPFNANSAPNMKAIDGDPKWRHALVRDNNAI